MTEAHASGDGAPSLWDFAVAVHARPGIADLCLTLQDENGADVPLVLWAGWLGRRGVALTPGRLAETEAGIGAWRRQVIVPLRRIRRDLKTAVPLPAALLPAAARLRAEVKSLELAAERLHLDHLAGLAAGWGGGSPCVSPNLALALGAPCLPALVAACAETGLGTAT